MSMFHSPVAPIASVSANTRRSHSAWNHGSSRSGSTGPKPCARAHVVRAVHSTPVPIIESRVTSPASRSSLQPSVPAGRIGTTR